MGFPWFSWVFLGCTVAIEFLFSVERRVYAPAGGRRVFVLVAGRVLVCRSIYSSDRSEIGRSNP